MEMGGHLDHVTSNVIELEPVSVKHYVPNICLPLNMAKFALPSFHKKSGLCSNVYQVHVIYICTHHPLSADQVSNP